MVHIQDAQAPRRKGGQGHVPERSALSNLKR